MIYPDKVVKRIKIENSTAKLLLEDMKEFIPVYDKRNINCNSPALSERDKSLLWDFIQDYKTYNTY